MTWIKTIVSTTVMDNNTVSKNKHRALWGLIFFSLSRVVFSAVLLCIAFGRALSLFAIHWRFFLLPLQLLLDLPRFGLEVFQAWQTKQTRAGIFAYCCLCLLMLGLLAINITGNLLTTSFFAAPYLYTALAVLQILPLLFQTTVLLGTSKGRENSSSLEKVNALWGTTAALCAIPLVALFFFNPLSQPLVVGGLIALVITSTLANFVTQLKKIWQATHPPRPPTAKVKTTPIPVNKLDNLKRQRDFRKRLDVPDPKRIPATTSFISRHEKILRRRRPTPDHPTSCRQDPRLSKQQPGHRPMLSINS